MADRRDSHEPGFDDELEHGWDGGLEIVEDGNERPSTGLGPDPGARKWILVGVGVSCLLTAGFVLLATHDVAPAHAAAIESSPEPSGELASTPSEAKPAPEPAPSLAAPSPTPRRSSGSRSAPSSSAGSAKPSSKADSTLAAGSTVAVQTKPHAVLPPKPTAPTKPATTPQPAAPTQPAPTKPVEPNETATLPSEPMPANSSAELPDVEPWDEADDEAVSADATVPLTPS